MKRIALIAMVMACCSCTPAGQQLALEVGQGAAEVCVQLARCKGVVDVASYCGLTKEGLAALEKVLPDPVCPLPLKDAGAD